MSLFGEPDEVASAERDLFDLKMKENQHVSIYITKFRSLSTRLDWNDAALAAQFRKGLPDRLLDLLAAREVKPITLTEIMDVSLALDLRYHERQHEKKKSTPLNSNTPNPNPKGKDSSKSPDRQNSSGTSSNQSNKSNPSKPNPPKPNTPNNKPMLPLGEDGHLKSNEKERRQRLGLCLYCGDKHSLEECPKRKAAALRATTTSTTPASTSDSGKE